MHFVKNSLKFLIGASFLVFPLLFPVATATEASLLTPVTNVRIHRLQEGTATNWSGYASLTSLTNPSANSVTFVGGNWVVPTLTCGVQTTYSSAWLGIDGYSDNSVEQIGTEHDCYQGRSYYSAWYEMYPKSMHTVGLAVSPGNQMHAEVTYIGNRYYRLFLKNLTTGGSYTTTQRMSALRESAEWVVEAPSSWFGVLPLSNFGTINLSNASATINGHTGVINDPAWQNDPITMVTNTLTPKAVPSALDSTGSAFSVTWFHN